MQSLLILPLQRERTRRGGREWGVSPHTAKGDGTSQEGRGDMKEGATTGGDRDDNIHENRTQYRLHTNSGHSTPLICLLSNCYISLINVSSLYLYNIKLVCSLPRVHVHRNGETTSHQLTQARYTVDTPVCVCVCVCVHVFVCEKMVA